MIKRTLITAVLFFALTVSAQDSDGRYETFKDICPTSPTPEIKQLNPQIGISYFWTQYVNKSGDIIVVIMDGATNEQIRYTHAGGFCDN